MTQYYYNISVGYHGRTCKVRYYNDGSGAHFAGYVSTLVQLRRIVARKFGLRSVTLYVGCGRKKQPLSADRHLREQLKRLGRGRTLHLSASSRAFGAGAYDAQWLQGAAAVPVQVQTVYVPVQVPVERRSAVRWSKTSRRTSLSRRVKTRLSNMFSH